MYRKEYLKIWHKHWPFSKTNGVPLTSCRRCSSNLKSQWFILSEIETENCCNLQPLKRDKVYNIQQGCLVLGKPSENIKPAKCLRLRSSREKRRKELQAPVSQRYLALVFSPPLFLYPSDVAQLQALQAKQVQLK